MAVPGSSLAKATPSCQQASQKISDAAQDRGTTAQPSPRNARAKFNDIVPCDMGQAMSFGLTQYDVEELMDHCSGRFSQGEIEGLYRRFRALDRGHKGYISAEEFMNIPELSINPLARRLERMFETVNFTDFVSFLSVFSKRASREDRLRFIFNVYDMDGDGHVAAEDLELMLRQLAGRSLSDEDIAAVVRQALQEASMPATGLTYEDFDSVLQNSSLTMQVEVPNDA